jgi:hypothetical protein
MTRKFFGSRKEKLMKLRNINMSDDWLWYLFQNEIDKTEIE